MEKTYGIQTDLSRYDNSWYKPGGLLKRILWHFCGRFFVNTYLPFPSSFKVKILKLFGATIGPKVIIKPGVNIKYPWFLRIGQASWIGEQVWIDNLTDVNIGSNVCLSQGCMLLTGNHDFRTATFDLMVRPITLEDGVWIGAKAVVCPGVTCKSHSVLAVGSVATKDLKEYSIHQGNPATAVSERTIKP